MKRVRMHGELWKYVLLPFVCATLQVLPPARDTDIWIMPDLGLSVKNLKEPRTCVVLHQRHGLDSPCIKFDPTCRSQVSLHVAPLTCSVSMIICPDPACESEWETCCTMRTPVNNFFSVLRHVSMNPPALQTCIQMWHIHIYTIRACWLNISLTSDAACYESCWTSRYLLSGIGKCWNNYTTDKKMKVKNYYCFKTTLDHSTVTPMTIPRFWTLTIFMCLPALRLRSWHAGQGVPGQRCAKWLFLTRLSSANGSAARNTTGSMLACWKLGYADAFYSAEPASANRPPQQEQDGFWKPWSATLYPSPALAWVKRQRLNMRTQQSHMGASIKACQLHACNAKGHHRQIQWIRSHARADAWTNTSCCIRRWCSMIPMLIFPCLLPSYLTAKLLL